MWERVEGPSLNKKGGLRFVLSHTWDWVLQEVPGQLSRDTCVVQADPAETLRRPCETAETSYFYNICSSKRLISVKELCCFRCVSFS